MDSALTSLGEAKVFDGICHVDVGGGDADVAQRSLQQLAGRADERNALPVLYVTGLLTDQSHRCLRVASREHDLSRRLPKLTASAGDSRLPKLVNAGSVRHPFGGAHLRQTAFSHRAPRSRPMLSDHRRAADLPA